MISVYGKDEQNFDTLGLGTLSPSSCVITEELNGSYEVTLSHPYDKYQKWKRIEKGNIIAANTPLGLQPFRIYYMNPTMDSIEVRAKHIFYDLLDNLCLRLSTGVVSAQNALNAMKESFAYSMPFDFTTDIVTAGQLIATRENPVMVLLSEDEDIQSFVKVFGGEIKRDGYQVSILASLGLDRGMTVAYRKNLVGLAITEDITDTATRIYPVGKEGLTLTGDGYVDSQHINDYAYPRIRVIEDTNATTQTQLNQLAVDFFNAGGDLPLINIKVNFQELAQTEEYKNYAHLEQVFLGDVVTIINEKMNFSKKAKVISYEYDCLANRYHSIELGDFTPSIVSSITSGKQSYAIASGASTEVKQVLSLISGTVTIQQDALYICVDGPTVEQSQQLFRFGKNGLEYSSNGGAAWHNILNSDGSDEEVNELKEWALETFATSEDVDNIEQWASSTFATEESVTSGDLTVKEWTKQTYSNPNLLINGDFQVWQRGESFTGITNGTYTADRFFMFAQGSADVERDGEWLKFTPKNSGVNTICTIIEVPESIRGKTVTLSFKAKASEAIGAVIYLWNGKYNAGTNNIGSKSYSLTTAEQLVSVTFGIPEDCEQLDIWFTRITNALDKSVWITECKLEIGEIATAFVPKGYIEELAACQRYYIRYKNSELPVGYILTGVVAGGVNAFFVLPCGMRILPTVSGDYAFLVRGDGKSLTSITHEFFSYIENEKNGAYKIYFVGLPEGDYPINTFDKAIINKNGSIVFDAEIY